MVSPGLLIGLSEYFKGYEASYVDINKQDHEKASR